MHAAHDQGWLVDGILLTIIIAYLGIALQFWLRRRGAPGGRAATALSQLVVIFVFCAFCGYLPRVIYIPEAPLLAAHIVLAVAAWAYFLAGQVDRLSVAVDDADRDNPEHQARRRAEVQALMDQEAEACARLAESTGSSVTAALIRERVRKSKAPAPVSGGAAAAEA